MAHRALLFDLSWFDRGQTGCIAETGVPDERIFNHVDDLLIQAKVLTVEIAGIHAVGFKRSTMSD